MNTSNENALKNTTVGATVYIRDTWTSNTLLEGTITCKTATRVLINIPSNSTVWCVMIRSGKIVGGDEFLRCYSGADEVLEDTCLMSLERLANYLRHNDLHNVKAWLQQYDDFMGVYTVPIKEGTAKVFLKSRIAAHYSYEV